MFRVWNTRSRQLEEFVAIRPPHVGLYTCGPTVYNDVTLGNWRAFLFDDWLARSLRFFGYDVTHVMNITDVGHPAGDVDEGEDKIEREAAKRAVDAWELARTLETGFLRGMDELGIARPTIMPRATEHIAEQIRLIQELESKGYTYQTSDGIYFDTSKFAAYGALSGQRLDEKEAGARVDLNPEKRNATDFALWKFSLVPGKRQMEWESPWGIGFPGWHIECSAMAEKYLGQPFDIHCGGIDHVPVHHENEIAQSEAAHEKPLANYWLHNEFLLIDGGRMGKSLGNAYTLKDVHDRGFDAADYRFFCFGAHYRSKLNFTWEALEGAKQARHKLKNAFLSWEEDSGAGPVSEFITGFREALEEDLNTAKALAVAWEVIKSNAAPGEKRATLLAMDDVIGLGMKNWKQESQDIPEEIKQLAEERFQARQNKNWAESDRLRDEIAAKGWMVKDEKEGYSINKI
ncbi:cysteine--tRNA ligase [Patescibacteria group bacterium]|nr:cysteine--tRNA ligase [Patescibacteria group bacterium]